MHHQRADGALVDLRQMDRAHRAAVAAQGLRGRARLGIDEIAHRLAREITQTQRLGAFARRDEPLPFRLGGKDREERLAGPVAEHLQLAVLVDRTERADRRRTLAVLAEALPPQLPPPRMKRRKPVGIGPEHRLVQAAVLGQREMQRGALRAFRLRSESACERYSPAPARSALMSMPIRIAGSAPHIVSTE